MARHFHVHVPPLRLRAALPQQPAALLLILVLAALAAIWTKIPPVASLLPLHPPG